MNVVSMQAGDEGTMTKSELERIATLEAQVEHLKQTIDRVISLEAQVVRLAQAQEQRNRLREREHTEDREDRRDFGFWLRWGIDRAVPLVALLALAYITIQGPNR